MADIEDGGGDCVKSLNQVEEDEDGEGARVNSYDHW